MFSTLRIIRMTTKNFILAWNFMELTIWRLIFSQATRRRSVFKLQVVRLVPHPLALGRGSQEQSRQQEAMQFHRGHAKGCSATIERPAKSMLEKWKPKILTSLRSATVLKEKRVHLTLFSCDKSKNVLDALSYVKHKEKFYFTHFGVMK